MPRAIGGNIITDHVEITAESALESLVRSSKIHAGKIDLFLRQDFRITNTLRCSSKVSILEKEAERIPGRNHHFAKRVLSPFRKQRLPCLDRMFATAYNRHIRGG